jgi:N,N-dimethylformamidase
MVATAATAALATVPTLLTASSAEAQSAYDPLQRFIALVPGGNGIIYAIQADGTMYWYRNTGWASGAATWANGGTGRVIGSGWNIFTTVLGSANGQIFAISGDGTIRWYQYNCTNLSTGAGSWAGGGRGPVIGSGFDIFPRIIGGFDSQFFCIDNSGALWWYEYTAGNGSVGWANGGTGQQIGQGWLPVRWAWTEPGGVIYAVTQAGALVWYRYLGSGRWANGGSGVTVGSGWGEDSQKLAFADGSGVVYAITLTNNQVSGTDDTLNWYRLTNSQTVTAASGPDWANSGRAVKVGTGFTYEATAPLQGYAASLSVQPGATQTLGVSTTLPSYTWSVVQLAPAAGTPPSVMGPTTAAGELQVLQSGFRQDGCGWTGPSFTVPSNWSGIYAAVLTSPYDQVYYAPFVVPPTKPTNPIAFLMPANTYNAYNVWAGHSRYSSQDNVNDVTLTFQRPSTSMQVGDPACINHTLYHDLFLLRWMSANNIAFDCYCDGDLDASGTWLSSYKALVIGGHPEYWSANMRANLLTYLNAGGILICPGGNAFYEITTFGDSGTTLTWSPINDRNLYINNGEPEAEIIGANWNAAAYLTFAPFEVEDASHPLLAGTSLANGDLFGENGYNGPASGWEVNGPIDTTEVVGTATLLAQGDGQSGNGAAMVYIDRSANGGGWVFSANAISFNGAIPSDASIQQILKNVFAQVTQ